MKNGPAPIWDLPTRLFHWSLPVLLLASWGSEAADRMTLHAWCGYALLVLVMFRIAWGFVGSTHARFADFVRGPRAAWRHLRGERSMRDGHNPAGGWSVLVMLAMLLAQALTGLLNADDVAFSGPLAHLLDGRWPDRIASFHDWNFDILLVVVGVHVLSVLLYQRAGTDLLRPMLNGGRAAEGTRTRPVWIALLVIAVCALALWGVLEFADRLVPEPEVFL